jgi:hypothetical protein
MIERSLWTTRKSPRDSWDLFTVKGCAATDGDGRKVGTPLLFLEGRVGRKPRTLAVGIPTEVDR